MSTGDESDSRLNVNRRTVVATLSGLSLAAAPALSASTRATSARGSAQRGKIVKAYADGPFGQIHYRASGDQSSAEMPIMCLHPSPLSGIVYDYWLAEIGRDRFAVAPDTPGFGGSDAPKTPPRIEDLADAMVGFMDSVGLRTVDVMGYHTGSLTAADLALRYPTRIRKVVMISAPIFDQAIIDEYKTRIYQPPPPFAEVLATTAESLRESPRGMFTDMSEERYEAVSIERLRRYRTGNWGFRAAFAYELTEALPQIDQAILILNPEDDLFEHTRRAQPFLRNGRIHDLPGWTHGHLDKYTKEMAQIVRAFLAE